MEKHAIRLLMVEDHCDTVFILTRLFQLRGYEVESTATVKGARELVGSKPFDVMLSGIDLPDGDGCDLMRSIKADYPILGIALTGYGMDLDKKRCFDAGFSAHVLKPTSFETLAAVVEKVAAGEVVM